MPKWFFSILLCPVLTVIAVEQTYPVTGTLYPIQSSKLSAQVAGRIETMVMDIGDQVAKDQVLVKLDPTFFDMEYRKQNNTVELSKIAYEEAEREFSRMKNLWDKKDGEKASISQKKYEDAETHMKQKKIALDQALIDLEYFTKRLDETSVKAPYAGVITKRFVDAGESITTMPVTYLIEIMDHSKLIFEFSLPQDVISQVKPGMVVSGTIDGQAGSFEGKIETVFPHIDIASRCFKCRVIIDNEKHTLTPGQFARGKIILK